MFRQLFGTSEKRVGLLNKVAPSFFGVLQVVLQDDVISGIARITDKRSTCGKPNLVLRQLVDSLDPSLHTGLIDSLRQREAVIETAVAFIREIRHKRLAHRDLNCAIAPDINPLPGISREAIEQARQRFPNL